MKKRLSAVLVGAVIVAILAVPLPRLSLFGAGSVSTVSGTRPLTTSAVPPGPSTTVGKCGPFPPRTAWALAISSAGQILWKSKLATKGNMPINVPPVVSDGIGYFAQDDAVHALRLSSGRSLWSWGGDQSVYGTWLWQGVLAVLTDQVSNDALLTGLDARTGAVRWQVRIGGHGLIGTQAATTDGGLAWLRSGGRLQVVNLANGRIRWTVELTNEAIPVAADGLVFVGQNGVVSAYDDLTGRRRWSISGLPQLPVAQTVAGLILVTDGIQGGDNPTVLTAIDPLSGHVAWRFDPGAAVTVLTAGPAGLAVDTGVPRDFYLLAPRTGRILWQKETFVASVPAVLDRNIVSIEGGVSGYPVIRLVDRDALNGVPRWQLRLPATPAATLPVVQVGPLVVVQSLLAYHVSDGRRAWRVTIPDFLQIPALPTKEGIIVQSATPGYACALAGDGTRNRRPTRMDGISPRPMAP